ncbi:hypothetical protein ILUMI_22682 [Ignelater luminosus]|uniref:Uncharacterized protein n=1 Tax=Ignelater luminosus TaxID=2038154 RepID=A0A8K0CA79_IGNLU|nr:hypothetical protein ILUMI_22682 [Ignelater luminosus]
MKLVIIFVVLYVVCFSKAQFFNPQKDITHQAVLQSAAEEALLPPSLLNPFYKNPKIRSALAKNSWFGPGERQVKHREADKISRDVIFTVLNHAGLLPQQQIF